jgi:uncharacterized membrane protein YkvA (DUF1232 family)
LAVALLALINMPHSPLRDLLVQVLGWAFAVICAVYCVAPVDAMPELLFGPVGWVDDLGAAIAGFVSARAAWLAGNARRDGAGEVANDVTDGQR